MTRIFPQFGEAAAVTGLPDDYSSGLVDAINTDIPGTTCLGWRKNDGSEICLIRLTDEVEILYQSARRAGESQAVINQIISGLRGDVWFGLGTPMGSGFTGRGGLGRWREGQDVSFLTIESGLPSNNVQALMEDREGVLWIGTTSGLARFDGSRFETFTTEDGLPHRHVRCVHEGVDGEIWIGTDNGAAHFDGSRFQAIRLQGVGLVSGIVHDSNGVYWLATKEGLVCYLPSRTPPGARIVAEYSPDREVSEITASTATNRIVFTFRGISFRTRADDMLYTWRLEGHDDEWSSPSNGRQAVFAGVDVGVYTFEVIAIDRDLNRSIPARAALTVTADPAASRVDFNPTNVARVSNEEFQATFDGEDLLERKLRDITDAYRDQVATEGQDPGTKTAAEAMLTAIESSLAAEGSSLSYPVEFYTTVRDNMLSRVLKVSDMYDTVLNRHTIPFVYFTNESDTDGVHHPFMVIATRAVPEGMTHLWDVPRPPGDGTPGPQYPDQKVTRNAASQDFVIKIPMKDYGEVETLTENTLPDNLATDEGVSSFTHLNYSSVSSTGVAIDGVVVYPTLNNTLSHAQEVGEITSVGPHSGRGLGMHYHADAHSATGRGFNLYNAEDYEGRPHPPVVSFGWDGVAGYGRYQEGDTTSDGVNEALDDWGGHRHGIYAYHYHSETMTTTASNGSTYTNHMLPPKGAWRGKIENIPEFWDGRQPGGRTGCYHGIEQPPMPKPALSADK